MLKKVISLILVLCLLSAVSVTASASEMGELESYGVRMIQYYLHHGEAAQDVIWDLTRQLKELDRKQGAAWEKIMFDWSWINSSMTVYEDCLPDGLPEDDSLCIVVMGFGLNPDGSMKQELLDRLSVALASARKYPNAYVLVTGGQTGEAKGITEAGQMGAWLEKKGLEPERVLRETQSLSTTANAVNCYKLLTRSYPGVKSIAIVTSDYHITASCALFAAMSNYQSGYKGGNTLELVGNAVCDTGTQWDSRATQAWGMSQIMGLPYEENTKAPKLYRVERPVEPVAGPMETQADEDWPLFGDVPEDAEVPAEAAAVEEETELPGYLLPGVAAAVLLVIFWLLIPKRPGKKHRRKKPEMKWE